MRRLSTAQRSEIRNLAKSNFSLNKISKKLLLSKSTIYYWYRKDWSIKYPKIKINSVNQENMGEFLGLFAGDGNYTKDKSYRHQIRIFLNAKDKFYISQAIELIYRLCNKMPWAYTIESDNVTILRILSKDLINFIKIYLEWDKNKTKTIRLANRSFTRTFKTGFLRGLIDSDGYIDQQNGIAVYSTISRKLANNIEILLSEFKISYKRYLYEDKRGNRSPIIRIRISKDFKKFIKIVRPKRINYYTPNTTLRLGSVVV